MKENASVALLIREALQEDIGKGDLTTRLCIPKERRCRGKVIVREEAVVAGLWLLPLIFNRLDRKVKVRLLAKEGKKVPRNELLATLEGPAGSILTGERVSLNFLSHLFGIATLTRRYLQQVKPYRMKILATRKTTPGWRFLEKYAVQMGGGEIHRMGLYDEVLVKENHLLIASKSWRHADTLRGWIQKVRRGVPKGIKIVVEAQTLREARGLLSASVDKILLDNLTPKQIRKVVLLRNRKGKRPLLQASGGVTLETIRKIAGTGIEEVSVGRLTHSAPAVNISVDIDKIR